MGIVETTIPEGRTKRGEGIGQRPIDRKEWKGGRWVSSSRRYGGPGVMDCGSRKCTMNVATVGCRGIRKSARSIVETTILTVGVEGKWAAMYGQQPL